MSKLKIGVNVFSNKIDEGHPSFEIPMEKGGLDFVVCHFSPSEFTVKGACEKIKQVMEKCRERGLEVIVNHEFQNFCPECAGKDGWDWASDGDGCHRLNLPEEYKQTLADRENCVGVMYDEFEHTIINRNLSLTLGSKGKLKIPVFPLLKEKNILKQGELLGKQLKEYAESIKKSGIGMLCGEHVFPVLFHTFARNGITPNFKSQKESYSNVQYAAAAGAALEYGTQLFNCVDLWYRNTCPGHTPKEMFYNLCFAFLAGVDRVYVETAHHFIDSKDGQDVYNEYGKKFSDFAKDYRGAERDYSVRDYRPEIGIIKYDDSFWGQKDPVMWRFMLFGNKDIKPVKQSYEWLQAMRTVTHGETSRYGVSWDKISPWSLHKHRSFASMNGAAVFDDRVRRDKLESLSLCFLCGVSIEEETLRDVRSLVKENGLTVVTPERFVPDELKSAVNGRYSEIPDGKGKWIVSDCLCSRKVRKSTAPLLGKKGEIRLRFGDDRTVRLAIDKNGEGFTVLKR